MKKIILLMLGYIAFVIVIMFIFEKCFNYDWTPSTPQNQVSQKNDNLIKKVRIKKKKALSKSNTSEVKNLEETALTENQNEEEEARLLLKEQLEEKNLVDIETLNAEIFLDMRYAGENNFTNTKLYKTAKCYLKEPVAKALVQAAVFASEEKEPFYLCIYDCYRPDSIQKIMLSSAQKSGYLATVSNHSRGMAVDVGPCDKEGNPLVTPTEFDTFSELSGAYNKDKTIPREAIKNRTALQKIMKKAGFSTISNEWWHFDYKDAKKEEVLDIIF